MSSAAELDLAARVARLEAIEVAKATTARYARACDTKDIEALRTEVFTDDAVLRLPTRELHGIDAIAKSYRRAFEAHGPRRHFIVNHIAERAESDLVELASYFVFVSQDGSSVIGWGAYRDIIVIDGPVGRIRDKTILVDVYTNLDDGWAVPE